MRNQKQKAESTIERAVNKREDTSQSRGKLIKSIVIYYRL